MISGRTIGRYAKFLLPEIVVIRCHRVLPAALVMLLLVYLVPASAQYPESFYQEMRWRLVGPFRGGRTRAVAGVPSRPNLFYIGVVNGGVWRSDDYGRTWAPIFDGQPTQSIGSIAVAPSRPDTIYVASGEGLERPDLSVGNGIYKSTDAGKTWTHLGLRDAQQIPALAVDPRNPDRIFAAALGHPYGPNAERGIFRSTDGGASWEKVLYKDENTGGSDVEIDPQNPDVVYAALWQSRLGPSEDNNQFSGTGGGLFKSTDGGRNWKKLTNGLPQDLVEINVAIAPSEPRRLYATLSTTHPSRYGSDDGLGFYRSDDGGESWQRITSDPRPAMKIGGGDLPVPKVDPQNPDVVYSASIVTVRSTDGGKSWTGIRGAPGGDDYQNLWINPEHPNIILLVSDQGAIVSVNGGETWSSWYNQPTAQLFHVSATNEFPYKVCGAQQESGSVCILSRANDGEITNRDWHPVGVIEYGYVAPDPLDPDIIYGAGRTEVSRFHWSTGQTENVTPIPLRLAAADYQGKSKREKYRVDRTEPILFSPVDPHVLYYAASAVFETRDGGYSWRTISPDLTREHPGIPASVGEQAAANPKADQQRGAVYALAASFRDRNTLWAGTDDGLVWITHDGGKNWRNITPPELTAWSKVTQISPSHFDDQTAYMSVSRFRLDDLHPYLYRTRDGGKTWESIARGLPDDAPVNTVREDPVSKNLLFAGTENAVWVSFNGGDQWQSLELNLPHTSMRDLVVHENDLIVATHGRSFWILDDIAWLRQLAAQAGARLELRESHLFQPSPAIRVRRDTNSDTPVPPDEPAGENPPDGAIIDYYLPQAVSGPLKLNVIDSQGRLVRSFSSLDKPEPSEEELRRELIPLFWLRPTRILSSAPGMHRWVWDLRYPPPKSIEHEYPIAAVPHDTPRYPLGPLVVPGEYKVLLTAEGKTYTAALTVRMDPRVKASPADLSEQFALETGLVGPITETAEAVEEARSLRGQLKRLAENAKVSAAAKALEEKIALLLEGAKDSSDDSPALANIHRSLLAVYKEIERADARPTLVEEAASTSSEADARRLLGQWASLKAHEISDFNRQLSAAGLELLDTHLSGAESEGTSDEN